MRDIFKKLNSKQGASFLIALVYFLVAMVVAGLIIASAVTNSSRIQNREGDEQAYLIASSAAQLMKEDIKSMECVLTKEGAKDSGGTWSLSQESDSKYFLSAYVNKYVPDICNGNVGSADGSSDGSSDGSTSDSEAGSNVAADAQIYTFSFAESTDKPEDTSVRAVARIRGGASSDEDSYTIDCLIEGICRERKYYMTLTATASKTDVTNKVVEHDNQKQTDGSYDDKTTTKKTRTIKWSGCSITKGDSKKMKSLLASLT